MVPDDVIVYIWMVGDSVDFCEVEGEVFFCFNDVDEGAFGEGFAVFDW